VCLIVVDTHRAATEKAVIAGDPKSIRTQKRHLDANASSRDLLGVEILIHSKVLIWVMSESAADVKSFFRSAIVKKLLFWIHYQ